ncbi:MAG TPA: glycosyltransferase [Opitutales bacterium]|nr:glycosyltransferase [Opitutales bacterium]
MTEPIQTQGGANHGEGAAGPRILILTSSTGGGHDSRAYSLQTWLEKAGAEARVEHLLENSSWLPRFGVWVYNTIQKCAPGLHNLYWYIAEGFARAQGARLSFGRDYFVKLLTDFRPQLVISMHDCLNRGYFQCAVETLGNSVRTATYCGEWSGGFGYSLNWVEKSADLFVARTEQAREFALEAGMPAEKAEVFCNLLPGRAFEKPMDDDARGAFRASVGLFPGRFTVLLAAGAAGANNHVRLLDALARIPGTQAIAFCGKSHVAARRIAKWKQAHPDYPLFVEGYSQRVHTLLQAADCVVSRGGANTTAEALYHATPILFNRLGGVMPQERLTLNYFTGHGAALEFSSAAGFGDIVRGLVENPERQAHLKSALGALRREDRPEVFAKRLIALAREAAPEKVRA